MPLAAPVPASPANPALAAASTTAPLEESAPQNEHDVNIPDLSLFEQHWKSKRIIKPKTRTWADIPKWNKGDPCYLFEMPSELADKILGEPSLGLRDHVALAASCKVLRAAYTPAVWKALAGRNSYISPYMQDLLGVHNSTSEKDDLLLSTIFSSRTPLADLVVIRLKPGAVAPSPVKKKGKKRALEETADIYYAVRSPEHQKVIDSLLSDRISKTEAKAIWKVSDAELAVLAYSSGRNMWNPRNSTQLFVRCAVEALAYRSHGGPDGHAAYLQKLIARGEKAKATRVKNGTLQKKTNFGAPRRRVFYGGFDMAMYF